MLNARLDFDFNKITLTLMPINPEQQPSDDRPSITDADLSDWMALQFPSTAVKLKANAKRQTWRLEHHGRPLLVKWYRLPDQAPWPWLKRHNPASHVARMTDIFAAAQIRTVAVEGCRVQSAPERAALLVLEWLEQTDLLHNLAHQPDVETRLQQGLLSDIMRQMVRLHRLGWVHGDLKWGNILIRENQAWFIDLDGVHRKRPGRSGMRDLARFMVDCDEAECSQALKESALQAYAEHAEVKLSSLRRAIQRDYDKIHKRHQKRYDGSRNMPHWPTE